MNTKNLMDVNYFFKIPRNIQSKKKIFKNLYLRYDINEIKHEIEEGKRKIKFFRELSQKQNYKVLFLSLMNRGNKMYKIVNKLLQYIKIIILLV